jgi:hypothetical protein
VDSSLLGCDAVFWGERLPLVLSGFSAVIFEVLLSKESSQSKPGLLKMKYLPSKAGHYSQKATASHPIRLSVLLHVVIL